MSLIKYGIAAAVGYHLGQPRGRKQLERLRRQVMQLSTRPEVKQWRERGWDIADEGALAAKRLASTTLAGRTKTRDPVVASATSVVDDGDPTAGTTAAPTGFGGRTVAEDSEAAISGLVPPPPVGRTTPPSSVPRP